MFDLLSPEMITLLMGYLPLASFIIGLIGGEEILIFFAVLAGNGAVSFWKVALFSIIGMILADTIIFNFSRSKFMLYIIKRTKKSRHYQPIKRFLDRLDHKNHFIFLFVNRFFYGLRTLSVIKMSGKKRAGKKMNFKEFIGYDIPAILGWCAIMLTAGWLAGRGFTLMLNLVKDIRLALEIGLAFLLILYILENLIKNKLLRE